MNREVSIETVAAVGDSEPCLLPLYATAVAAGFPSPADDYIEQQLDLNAYLIARPLATFLARARGSSMMGRGIFDGDILVVDRSLTPQHGNIVVAAVNGELTCKVLDTRQQCLMPANPNMAAIAIDDYTDLVIEGVVVHSIRQHVCTG